MLNFPAFVGLDWRSKTRFLAMIKKKKNLKINFYSKLNSPLLIDIQADLSFFLIFDKNVLTNRYLQKFDIHEFLTLKHKYSILEN